MRTSQLTVWLIAMATAFSSLAGALQTIHISDTPSQITIFDASEAGLRMRVNIGTIDFVDVTTAKGRFTMARIDGLVRSNNIGEPNLPVANRLISIPYGCDLAVEVENMVWEEISLGDFGITDPLLPAQPSLSKSQKPEDVPFEMNDDVYAANAYYSLPRGMVEVIGIMRSLRLGLVSVSPLEYNPVSNTLRVCKEITVRVEYRHPDWASTYAKWRQYYSPVFEPVYDRITNYQPIAAEKDTLTRYPVKYVIISHRMFENQLQPFIEWKTKKGFIVQTFYTDEIGSSNTAIKSHLDSMYQTGTPEDPAPSFVLLVGDAQQIAPFDGTAGNHITDLYFCEFTGDKLPEIYYGRFSAQNAAQLQPQIDKTLEYERYEMPDPSYLGEVTLIAGADGTYAITYGNGQINYGTNLYFNEAHGISPNVWLYPASAGSGVEGAVIQTINDGLCLANYTAHCGHTEWSDPNITTTDVQGFTNYHKYLLGIGNCCLSNTFGADYSTPCFGEVWMQLQDRGGIGYIGGSNSTYWDEDYWWGVGYGPVIGSGPTYEQTGLGAYDGLFHDHGEPVANHYVTNAAVIYAGNLAVNQSTSDLKAYYWEIYHILGDPSVMTYLGVPLANTVQHPNAIFISDASVTVSADPGSYVGISVDGEFFGAGYVDASGQVDVALKPFTQPGVADVVVTAQNRQPYMSTIQVITPSGPYVIYSDDQIDDATGNGNGLVDYGESIIMGLEVKNVGPDTAYEASATLSSADTYVKINDSTESFGTIPGDNGIADVADAFSFDVSPDIPDGYRITFAVTVADVNDSSWTSSFKKTAHAPVAEYVSVVIDDGTGNGNGILDPGETASLTVTVANGGSGQADEVTGVLTTGDAYVTIGDGSGTFGTVLTGGSGDNGADVFVVTAPSSCPRGHQAAFGLTVSAVNGYVAELGFGLIVGDRVAVYADDFSYDQGWSGLGGSGEWMLAAAAGGAGSDSYGSADPAVDHSPTGDNGVLGVDLTSGTGGDYNTGLSTTYWVTSPVIDCGDFNGVVVSFYRWLGVEQNSYDHAYFQVYDGSAWVTVYESGSTPVDESSWGEQVYDVSAHADSNGNFQMRFGIGPTDGSVNYCGWNVDDVMVRGYGERKSAGLALSAEAVYDSLLSDEMVVETVWVYNESAEAVLRVRFDAVESWLSCLEDQQYVDVLDSVALAVSMTAADLAPGDYEGHVGYVCNDYSHPYDTVVVYLHVYAPQVSIGTTMLTETVRAGEQVSRKVEIANLGPGRLEYTAGCHMFGGGKAAVVEPAASAGMRAADAGKSSVTEAYYGPAAKGSGGPDGYGYTWLDSDAPGGPVYSWEDITGVGTAVSLADDAMAGPLPLGFAFPFYGASYTEAYIGSNGIVTFGTGSTARLNMALPTAAAPNNLAALWWDDLDPGEGGGIYYYADAANERFVVSFEGVPNYISGGGTGSLTFQAIFYARGKIVLQYEAMAPGQDADGLTGATIGIEDAAGAVGLQVVYNASYVHDHLAVVLNAERWLSVSPGSGTVEPYSEDTLVVTMDATDLEVGEYTGQVTVTSNDPVTPTAVIPVAATVQDYTCGDANGDETANLGDAVYIIKYVFTGGQAPDPLDSGDANGDGLVNIADAIYLINFVFKNGPPPSC